MNHVTCKVKEFFLIGDIEILANRIGNITSDTKETSVVYNKTMHQYPKLSINDTFCIVQIGLVWTCFQTLVTHTSDFINSLIQPLVLEQNLVMWVSYMTLEYVNYIM